MACGLVVLEGMAISPDAPVLLATTAELPTVKADPEVLLEVTLPTRLERVFILSLSWGDALLSEVIDMGTCPDLLFPGLDLSLLGCIQRGKNALDNILDLVVGEKVR
jgi:hypothetical protein